MSSIAEVRGREILDSRGNPTVEVEVELISGARGRAAVGTWYAGSQNWRDDPVGFANHLGGALSHTIASASSPPGSSDGGGSSGGGSSGGGGGGGGGSGW